MNKHAYSLCVTAALAVTGAAHAQSSVTLYGVVDLSLAKVSGQDLKLAGASPLTNGTSRFGLRGTEDLGGGMKASFNFEAQVNPETGATGDPFFGRAANMTLSGGFGSVLLGRTLTPGFRAVSAWELSGSANYNPVSSQFSYVGVNSRNNSQISYTTPSFGGFTATVAHILKANTSDGRSKSEFNVIYRAGPLAASMAYNKLSGGDANHMVGAAYDFGAARVAASYHDATGAGRGKGFTLGAKVPAGPVSLIIDVARDTENKDTDMLLEARYPLSKRTFAYFAHSRNGKGKAAVDVNASMLGVRHNF
ncbi:MAG: porin [Burkholderiales bacterium]|nr:MAG: porin [Burkholderiales bacterium]